MSNPPIKPVFDTPFALSMGPQRAGTTWLDRYLRSRGDICLPRDVKEVFFFDKYYERGEAFYAEHFHAEPQHRLTMEITATSFDCPEAPKRVQALFGSDARLICPLRNPLIRSYSLYLHYLRYGIVSGSLQEAAEQVPQIIESSRYVEHLSRWADGFGLENIHILYQEQLESDQDGYIRAVCEALNIPYLEPSETVQGRFNVTTYSKFGPLAKAAQNTADWLRSRRLYAVINVAKALGAKRLIFGKERPDASTATIPETDLAWLQEKLNPEIEKFSEFLPNSPF